MKNTHDLVFSRTRIQLMLQVPGRRPGPSLMLVQPIPQVVLGDEGPGSAVHVRDPPQPAWTCT